MHLAWLLVLASTPGPAARGLDAFVFGPSAAPSGATLPLEVVALGFPTVTTLVPLKGAKVEAVWKPEDVGADLPAVRATADARGRAHLAIPMPPGEARALTLLLRIQGGERERTKELRIERTRGERLSLHVSDARVVPGSVISAWVVAEDEGPLVDAPIELALLEGGAVRWRIRTITDASGNARARVPIPRTDEVAWSWQLRASLVREGRFDATSAITLTTREETPATPALAAGWDGAFVKPGEQARARVRVLDATGAPVPRAKLDYWIGSRGTEPRDDAAWKLALTSTATGLDGELRLVKTAPGTIALSGSALALEVRAELDGHVLRLRRELAIGRPDPIVELIPEASRLVPGVPQRLLLRVIDGEGRGVAGRFAVSGDRLDRVAVTDAHGEAELSWDVPAGVGASHPSGMCASQVAATLVIRPLEGARAAVGRDRFERCLTVDRDARQLLVLDRSVARAGERVRGRVLGGGGRPFTLLVQGGEAPLALVSWADGERGGEIAIPPAARGIVQITAISAVDRGPAPRSSAALLAVPPVLPRIEARVSGGRASPGGTVELEVRLLDERGRGIPGTLSGSMHDLFGGGSSLRGLDSREQLTATLDLGADGRARLDAFFDGDPRKEPWRRAALSTHANEPLAPIHDPASDAVERFQAAFAEVIRSLEGAVLEAVQNPDTLVDVRRKTARGLELNPEMLTLVTGAMEQPPETPGGEPIVLEDLMALDPQVRFDRVARRIARLQLFRVLEAVRERVYAERLLPGELATKAPDSIVRRLVREQALTEADLRDPWGGTIGFVRVSGPPTDVPYLAVIRGFELRAPGPDGKLGTADDVRDPFERVLVSGTPYAKAVDEDRLVDARYEVVVGDATIEAWRSLFETLTGTTLGARGGGMGSLGSFSGSGSGGHGSGVGSIHAGRTSHGVSTHASTAIPAVRTDAEGRARIQVKLGDAETTWRITLVGVADGAGTATTFVDVPAYAPLSARVEAGQVWTEGDELDVEIRVRSRGTEPIVARLEARATGALSSATLAEPLPLEADGARVVKLRVRADRPGVGTIAVTLSAPGLPSDRLEHRLEVRPAGTEELRWIAGWIEDRRTLSLPPLAAGETPRGHAWVELSRGVSPILARALDALDPDRLTTLDAEVDALEAGARVARWAGARLDGQGSLVLAAEDVRSRALGRALQYRERRSSDALDRRLALWSAAPPPALGSVRPDACPEAGKLASIEIIELEPIAAGDVVRACWDNAIAVASQALAGEDNAELLARAVIALAERPHRQGLASSLADRLRERGRVLSELESRERSARALMAAARVRLPRAGDDTAAWRAALVESQDPGGGFGSPSATRAVITALIGGPLSPARSATVTVTSESGMPLVRPIEAERSARATLQPDTTEAEIHTAGGPVLARLSRPILRAWTVPPPTLPGAAEVEVAWPERAEVSRVTPLRLSVRHALRASETIEVRIPLPPGATLAEGRPGLIQSQGVLVAHVPHAPSLVPTFVEIPLRFGLTGAVTAPEAEARVVGVEGTRARAPARRIRIHARSETPAAP